jgi:hypothetical protein
MCCKCEKSKTPYFIPKTVPPTKAGIDKLRAEFYTALRRAGFQITK